MWNLPCYAEGKALVPYIAAGLKMENLVESCGLYFFRYNSSCYTNVSSDKKLCIFEKTFKICVKYSCFLAFFQLY